MTASWLGTDTYTLVQSKYAENSIFDFYIWIDSKNKVKAICVVAPFGLHAGIINPVYVARRQKIVELTCP